MFSGPTIREIATAIDREGNNDATIVPLQPVGTKPALIVGHTVGGLLFRYTGLVRHLEPDQPVFGLRPTASVLGRGRRLRLEDLAARYRDDILRLRPEGPYCLAGFCFGGIVMLEVAHQLEALGHTVAVLALFDAEPTSVVREFADRGARPRSSRRLLRREETAGDYVRRRMRETRAPSSRDGSASPTRVAAASWTFDPGPSARWTSRSGRSQRALGHAMKSYVVPATTCPLTLFRAGDPNVPVPAVRFVPGRDHTYLIDGPGVCHDALMDEPHVAALAGRADRRARSGRGVSGTGSAASAGVGGAGSSRGRRVHRPRAR